LTITIWWNFKWS